MPNERLRESQSCPLCKTPGCGEFASLPLEGFSGPCDYFRCIVCDLIFLDSARRLDPEAEKARYDLHENRIEDAGYRGFLQPAVEAIHQRIPVGGEGLDFGAGPGPAAAEMLRERGYSVDLYDLYFHPRLSVLEKRYDFVLSTEAAEHFHDPAAEFARLHGLLRSGGVLVVMTTLWTPEIDFAQWYYRRDPTHIVFYSEKTVAWIGHTFGFTIDEILPPRLFVLRNSERAPSHIS